MTPSKRYLNWSNVTFTPNGGVSIGLTGVSSIKIESGSSLQRFSGDGDRYNSLIVNDFNEPTITVQTADISAVRALNVGLVGTFSATQMDAANGTATGAVTYTMTNAVVASNSIHGAHRQFGQATLVLTAFSSDGVTNPLSTSIAT